MRTVIARCVVNYSGRLTAHLPEAVRRLTVKRDGTVLIEADSGYRPLNWMPAPCWLDDTQPGVWNVSNKAGERLDIELLEVLCDYSHDLGVEPGLVKDGVESHVQELLAAQVEAVFGPAWQLVRREHPTPIGPVDLMLRDPEGNYVAVEVKRKAQLAAVDQVGRYVEFLKRDPRLPGLRGMLVATAFAAQTRVLAHDRGIECLEVNYDELRGMEPTELSLF